MKKFLAISGLILLSISATAQLSWEHLGFKATLGPGTSSFGFHYHSNWQLSGGFLQRNTGTGGYLQSGYKFDFNEDLFIFEKVWIAPEGRIDYSRKGSVSNYGTQSLNTDFVLSAGAELFGLPWLVPSTSLLFGKNWFNQGLSMNVMASVTIVFGKVGS